AGGGVCADATLPAGSGQLGAIQGVAAVFSVSVMALDVREVGAIDRAVSTFAKEPNGGMIVLATPLASVHRDVIVQLAARERLPTIYPYPYFLTGGGLISYGIGNIDLFFPPPSLSPPFP